MKALSKQQAEFLIEALPKLLSGHKLVSVFVGHGRRPEVRIDQEFDRAYIVNYLSGGHSVGLSDTYGVMTGAEEWIFDPDKRSVHAKAINGYREDLWFTWRLQNNDPGTWDAFDAIRREWWKIPGLIKEGVAETPNA